MGKATNSQRDGHVIGGCPSLEFGYDEVMEGGPRPLPTVIKSGDLRGGFGFPPKAEHVRPTGKAFPIRFPPGNAAAFQETGSEPSAMKAAQRISLQGR